MLRTDLILERRELHTDKLTGAEYSARTIGNVKTECVTVKGNAAAKALGKSCGRYFTVEFEDSRLLCDSNDIIKSISLCLEELFDFKYKSVLVAGLGNAAVTPDSLGPVACNRIHATRHLGSSAVFSALNKKTPNISVLKTDVLYSSGIDAAELITAVVNKTKPDAVIVIDALAARRPQRLCKTVQLSDTGISPGSGSGGDRPAIDSKLLGIPVISIGIPTVIDSATYRLDCGGTAENEELMLTPISIDLLITRCAVLLSDSINFFFGIDSFA